MIYNNRDLTKKGEGKKPREKGERLLGWERSWEFTSSGEGSFLPRTLDRPVLCIFSPPKQVVASSKPNFWTHSLQIHYNGPGLKTRTRSENQDPTIIYKYIFLVDLDG